MTTCMVTADWYETTDWTMNVTLYRLLQTQKTGRDIAAFVDTTNRERRHVVVICNMAAVRWPVAETAG